MIQSGTYSRTNRVNESDMTTPLGAYKPPYHTGKGAELEVREIGSRVPQMKGEKKVGKASEWGILTPLIGMGHDA